MSDLMQDLVDRHLSDNNLCECGNAAETAEHYLLECPIYLQDRHATIYTLNSSFQIISTLLKGDRNLSLKDNTHIFETVQQFIKRTGRLT